MFVSVKVKVRTDNTGAIINIPGLLTPNGLLTPLLDYFVARYLTRSMSWRRKVVRSVELFMDYVQANAAERDTRALFDNFAKRLTAGTFGDDNDDPSGLCWQPRSAPDVTNIITDLTLFFEWLSKDQPKSKAGNINPLEHGSPYDQMWVDAARLHRRERALLGHLWPKKDDEGKTVRRVQGKRAPTSRKAEPPAFPEERFLDLISDGFRVGRRTNYRNILITLLMHGAGFRPSEPFHLYVEDVVQHPANPRSCIVRIHHPSEGAAPAWWKDPMGKASQPNRERFLSTQFGLRPRNQLDDDREAGWKGCLCDAPNYMEAHWLSPQYGELFWTNWKLYLAQVAREDRDHPFAFINLDREPVGSMFKLPLFNDQHAEACRRIGLVVAKHLGTTPHGHRHAYGRRCKKAGIEPELLRILMHHSSIESQEVYTQPTSGEVEDALQKAALKLSTASSPSTRITSAIPT